MKYETTYPAPEKLRTLTLDQLLTAWETTEYLNTPEVYIVRGWLMDEFERRSPEAFNAWMDQASPEDQDLRRFVTVNPICLDCGKLCNGCAGTHEKVWTGCIYRIGRNAK